MEVFIGQFVFFRVALETIRRRFVDFWGPWREGWRLGVLGQAWGGPSGYSGCHWGSLCGPQGFEWILRRAKRMLGNFWWSFGADLGVERELRRLRSANWRPWKIVDLIIGGTLGGAGAFGRPDDFSRRFPEDQLRGLQAALGCVLVALRQLWRGRGVSWKHLVKRRPCNIA